MGKPTSRRRFLKYSAYAGGSALLGTAGLNQLSPWIWNEPVPLEPNSSYWAGSQPPQNAGLNDDLDVDVAVVGGGYTGLSSAYFIRRTSPHKRVVVLEAKGCGNGASGRNGAMLLTMTADRYMNFSADPAMDKKIYDLTVENIRFLSTLSAATGIDCELETRGALQVLDTAAEMRAAKAYAGQARSLGIPVEYWDSPRLVDAIGTESYRAALFDPNCGQIHPMKLVHVLKAAAQAAGATIYENTLIQGVQEGRELLLHTSSGRTVKARSLVLATNAFTPRLGFLRNTILPLHEYVAMTSPLSEEELAHTGWRERIPFNDSRTEVFYLGVTKDRRIHIGGGMPRYSYNNGKPDETCLRSHLSQLQRELMRLYPSLSGLPLAQSWEGVIDWSLDASPSVGSTGRHKNIFFGIGYSGHGVNLSSLFGRIIADLEAGNEARWQSYPFVNNRLYYVPNEPFRWFAAESELAWYKLTES